MAIAAILLAADELLIDGGPVALAPWTHDLTLVEYQIEQLQQSGVHAIELVLGFGAETLISLTAHDNVEPIVNSRWRDPNASLRAGAAAVPRDTECAIIARVEEPRPSHVYRTLLDAHRGVGQVTRPAFHGTPGTPIVAGYDALAAIRNNAGDGLEGLLASWSNIRQVPVYSDVVLLTIHSQADYDRARSTLTGAP